MKTARKYIVSLFCFLVYYCRLVYITCKILGKQPSAAVIVNYWIRLHIPDMLHYFNGFNLFGMLLIQKNVTNVMSPEVWQSS